MCNYNHARFLPIALEAILRQSFQPLEVIVIDDGSSDDSVEVINGFAREHNIIEFHRNERNNGVVWCGNRGLAHARGDYFYWAAADDVVLPAFFEKSMALLTAHPGSGLCSSISALIDENGKRVGRVRGPIVVSRPSYLSPTATREAFQRHESWIMGNTTIYRREALIEAGCFRPELGSFCDGFVQQVVALRHGACFIPEELACWRRMEGGVASSTFVDSDKMMILFDRAKNLMLDTYGDLFPLDYVKRWEGDWLYLTGTGAWEKVRREQERWIGHVLPRLKSSDTLLARSFRAALRLSMRLQGFAVRLYLFVSFRSIRAWLKTREL